MVLVYTGFYNLPLNIIELIYSFDNTYHSIFKQLLQTRVFSEHSQFICFSCNTIHNHTNHLIPSTYKYIFKTKSCTIEMFICDNCLHEENFIVEQVFDDIISRRPYVFEDGEDFVNVCNDMKNENKHLLILYNTDSDSDLESDDSYNTDSDF